MKLRRSINMIRESKIEMGKFFLSVLSIFIIACSVLQAQEFYAYYTRTNYKDGISGKYADIIVSYGRKGEFVFSRKSCYLPYWKTSKGKWYVDELIHRKGNGTKLHPDKYNAYSYVRLIKNDKNEVIIQWRYYPDIQRIGLMNVVHEFYIFKPDGKVERRIRRGTKKYDDWIDPKNVAIQNLKLKENGIKQISFKKAYHSIQKIISIPGSQLKYDKVGTPAAYWSFNEGMKNEINFTKESVSGLETPIEGNKSYWIKGISGTALQFDGYFSGVKLAVQDAPEVNSLTIEAWIAMKAHPFGWVPIVEQAHWRKSGYYFGINAYGNLGFMANINGEWISLITKKQIPLNRWTYTSVTFSSDSSEIDLCINGKKVAEEKIDTNGEKRLIHANAPLSIGLNTDPLVPLPDNKVHHGTYKCITGFYGAIDEVRLFTNALSLGDIWKSYLSLKPDEELMNNPGFQKRILPGHPGFAKQFGARYTSLDYDKMYNDSWRSSRYPDIIVKFDQLPTSVILWRGTSYGPGWVTGRNLWMIDQSVEYGNDVSFTEHMSDKKGVYTHASIVENTNARVVIHWRYNCNDVLYSMNKVFGNAGLWVDEYLTIYPDGIGIRKVKQKSLSNEEKPANKVSWQDVQFLAAPGMTPDDVMNLKASYLADLEGDTAVINVTNGIPKRNPLPSANIELINLKSKYKVFLAFQKGTHIKPWGSVSRQSYCHFMVWDHWPVSFVNSEGRRSLFPDRVTHSAGIGAADDAVDHGNMAMYGFTDKPVTSLIPIVKSWNDPPPLKKVVGTVPEGYDKSQRAFIFRNASDSISFNINASDNSPIYDPCFVIKGWGKRGKARIKIDGKIIHPGKNFRQGLIYDTDGTKTLVIWIKFSSADKNSFSIHSIKN